MTIASSQAANLEELLSKEQLPALPQSAIRLLELAQNPRNGPAEFAMPVESDPGLTGQVLKFVNSSYFGFSRKISSVKLAITLVGIRTIKNFALWSAVFSLMPNPRCGPFDLKGLWQDSLRRALFARALAKLMGLEEAEETFAAALLQDMAIPLLAREMPSQYESLLNARAEGRMRLSHLEEEAFGWTHAKAAGVMARQWNLPEAFASLVEQHHAVEHCISQTASDPVAATVAISALLPTIADPRWHERDQFENLYQRIAPLGSPSVVELFAQVDREFTEFAPVLRLAAPSRSLTDSLDEVRKKMCGSEAG
jgi:HD-like signal output (HDOD) protein